MGKRKQKHTWAFQVMEELVSQTSMWNYEASAGFRPQDGQEEAFLMDNMPEEVYQEYLEEARTDCHKELHRAKDGKVGGGKRQSPKDLLAGTGILAGTGKRVSPILVAAMKGVEEMVEKIIESYPVAIRDVDQDGKNVVLLAVENRQPHIYHLLHQRLFASTNSSPSQVVSVNQIKAAFKRVDKDGNGVRHLVAKPSPNRPRLISGAFLQMLWEIQWYQLAGDFKYLTTLDRSPWNEQFIKRSMPRHFFARLNNKGQTAKEVFIDTHEELNKEARKWLNTTSKSCSVIAALTATAAFSTVTTVPDQVEGNLTLTVFALASLTALFFSIASLIVFLAIIIYDYEEAKRVRKELIFALNALILSIASMLISFFSSLSLDLKGHLKHVADFHAYAIPSCLLMTVFIIVFLPIYEYVIISLTFRVPLRTYQRHVSLISSME
ncbi:hypothetical protein ACLOJK_026759 [Asimina triloba]